MKLRNGSQSSAYHLYHLLNLINIVTGRKQFSLCVVETKDVSDVGTKDTSAVSIIAKSPLLSPLAGGSCAISKGRHRCLRARPIVEKLIVCCPSIMGYGTAAVALKLAITTLCVITEFATMKFVLIASLHDSVCQFLFFCTCPSELGNVKTINNQPCSYLGCEPTVPHIDASAYQSLVAW